MDHQFHHCGDSRITYVDSSMESSMKINKQLLRRSFKSWQINISTFVTVISGIYLSLPAVAQLSIYSLIQPYLPSGGVMGIVIGIVGIVLRARTTKPLSER
jgi:hypothetical protein